MSSLWQHIFVLLLAGSCLTYVVWQVAMPFFGRKGKVGNCCAHGCPTPGSSPAVKALSGRREIFLPVDFVGRKHRHDLKATRAGGTNRP